MTCKINNLIFTIKNATASEVKKGFNDNNPDSYYFGSTTVSTQTILINEEATIEKQKETLYHELMHCYIIAYLYDGMQFDEEALCNISAKSHDMIHEIVKQYFNKSR